MNQDEQAQALSQLIAKCWADDGFKQQLLADPVATLRAQGLELPAGQQVKVLENTEAIVHLVIPAKPTQLSDDDLDHIAAGTWWETLREAARSALPIASQIARSQ